MAYTKSFKLSSIYACLLVLLVAIAPLGNIAFAESINLLPKYGMQPKNEAQKAVDEKFIASIDNYYKGDRKKAAQDISTKGWQFLRQGSTSDAMRRFNQAWLLDKGNGYAIWGMAAIQASAGKFDESLKLFQEAEGLVGDDIDLAVDHARAIGMAGAQSRNDALLKDAFSRFSNIHNRSPQHTLNLQNWAITLFYVGNYAEAWKKIQLAEVTPRRADLDPSFIAALQNKMPRP
ncbi:MAG: hypothetical protein AB1697_01430 [Pseudomonadota bacterium]